MPVMRGLLRAVVIALTISPGVMGAGYGTPQQPAGIGLSSGVEVPVEVRDNEFLPAALRVAPGTTVVWRNIGRAVHDVTADDASWSSHDLVPGAEFRFTFLRPGVYRYFCVPHGFRAGRGMAGVVLVGGAELTAPPGPPRDLPGGAAPRTLRVRSQFPTVQGAVNAAKPGDLVLIAPGIYGEEVIVSTPGLTLRGLDRNRVILDGEFRRRNGIKVLGADGVVIENMTARHFTVNGFFWTGVRGYRGSYLTAYSNGDYGLYAFDSVYGQFDHSYASGHPDSGFYIGQCKPCHALISDVLAEHNALGYSGTNAGGDLTITRSVWRHNISGLVPNTLDAERLPPQNGARITGNLIYSNHSEQAPLKQLQYPAFGTGIILAGGINNVVEGNTIWDHPNFGILVIVSIDRNMWIPSGHHIRANTVWASGRADLALAAPAGSGTCFADNRFSRSRPPAIQQLYGCGSWLRRVGGGDPVSLVVMLRQFARAQSGRFTSPDWKTQPTPSHQPSMPDPLAPPAPAWPTPESKTPPVRVSSAPVDVPLEAAAFVPVAGSAPKSSVEYGRLVLYLLPFVVYDALVIAVAWDTRRRRASWLRRIGWVAATVVLPYLGAVLYVWRRRP